MNPKEKAEKLVSYYCEERIDYYYGKINIPIKTSKQCALIAVNEIKKVIEDNCLEYDDDYWDNVIIEIRKI